MLDVVSGAPQSPFNVSTFADPFGDTTVDARFGPGVVIAGRYQLVRKLGQGGMAEVWLAEHRALRQEVAVKFLRESVSGELAADLLARFRFEAQVSAKLGRRTRHVVGVHDAGEHDAGVLGAVPYLVMEYVSGPTLAYYLATQGKMDPAVLAGLLDQVADALAAAHEVGIVHRDVKPSNLMIVPEPDGSLSARVADFGIAKALRKDTPLDHPKTTMLGVRIGSPAYMSPEQVESDGEIGVQTDLWSLAVVAYEALTGRDCFRGRTAGLLYAAIGAGRFRPVTAERPDLPRALDAWFARALSVKPSERFQSAPEMARAFRAAIAKPGTRRTRSFAAATVVVALTLAAATTAYEVRATRPARRPESAPSSTTAAPPLPPAPPTAPSPPATGGAPSSSESVPAPIAVAPATSAAGSKRALDRRPSSPRKTATTPPTLPPPAPPPAPPRINRDDIP
jgi:serine/threonine protein kinase